MRAIDYVDSIDDLKNLPANMIDELCSDIRFKMIEDFSQTGGRLASNLAMVELAVALDRVYNPFYDQVAYNVGYRCYTHNLLMNRPNQTEQLHTISKMTGVSEKKLEDLMACNPINSISITYGIAKARTLLQKDYKVVSVIDENALNGGLNYEGLIHVGASNEPFVVVFIDDNNSLSKDSSASTRTLSKLRASPVYNSFKKAYNSLYRNPKNSRIHSAIDGVKENVKQSMLSDNIFVSMGFDYMGPVDGHNEKELESTLQYAATLDHPILIHVMTKKGKGYDFAETEPVKFDDIAPFDPTNGLPLEKPKETYTDHYLKTLGQLADKDNKICTIHLSLDEKPLLSDFAQKHSDRFFETGISQGHALFLANGMASQGLIPVVCISSISRRDSYELVVQEANTAQMHIVVGVCQFQKDAQGEEISDYSIMENLKQIDNMTVLAPSSFAELDEMLKTAIYNIDGPVVIFYPDGCEGDYKGNSTDSEEILAEGSDVTLISYGHYINQALALQQQLSQQGINAELVKLNRLWPSDDQLVLESIVKTKRVVVVENGREKSLGKIMIQTLIQLAAFDFYLPNNLNKEMENGDIVKAVSQMMEE